MLPNFYLTLALPYRKVPNISPGCMNILGVYISGALYLGEGLCIWKAFCVNICISIFKYIICHIDMISVNQNHLYLLHNLSNTGVLSSYHMPIARGILIQKLCLLWAAKNCGYRAGISNVTWTHVYHDKGIFLHIFENRGARIMISCVVQHNN